MRLLACTEKVYVAPGGRPVAMHQRLVPEGVQVPVGETVTTYGVVESRLAPPSEAGAAHENCTDVADSGRTVGVSGAVGTVAASWLTSATPKVLSDM